MLYVRLVLNMGFGEVLVVVVVERVFFDIFVDLIEKFVLFIRFFLDMSKIVCCLWCVFFLIFMYNFFNRVGYGS